MPYGTIVADKITTSDGYTLGGDGSHMKNRIINGGMVIDQRNVGANVTPTDGTYTLDRWVAWLSQASKLSVQQSSVAPAGFSNSMLVTSLSAYSVGASDEFELTQKIEGYNIADLAFGTSSAKTISVSFWVQSSITGTFSIVLGANNVNRTYPASYTISAANTWQYVTITVPGDTSGTWLTNNGWGLSLGFCFGAGSSRLGTSAWSSNSSIRGVTGQTNFVATSGATFYITGVQLEKGSTATSFDYRPYGAELQLCQRYYQKSYNYATVPGTSITSSYSEAVIFAGWGSTNAAKMFMAEHKVSLRPGTQSLSFWDIAGNASKISTFDTGFTRTDNVGPVGGSSVTENRHYNAPGTSTYNGWGYAYVVSSEL